MSTSVHGELSIEKLPAKTNGALVAQAAMHPAGDESLVSVLNRLASNPNFNPESFSVLMAAVREEQLISRRAEFATSMHAIQSARLRVHKTKQAKNSRYAPLEAIDDKLQPLLDRNGLSVSFDCPEVSESGLMKMALIIYHRNGYSEQRSLPMPIDDIGTNREGKALRPKVQDHGSTVSYSRRQLLKMTFNVVETDEDDDGQLGEGNDPITQDQADTIVSKCEEYGFTAGDQARLIRFAARLQEQQSIKLGQIRKCDLPAVWSVVEEMRRK